MSSSVQCWKTLPLPELVAAEGLKTLRGATAAVAAAQPTPDVEGERERGRAAARGHSKTARYDDATVSGRVGERPKAAAALGRRSSGGRFICTDLITKRCDFLDKITCRFEKSLPLQKVCHFKTRYKALIEVRLTWREMENLILGRFIRIFGEFLRNFEEIGLLLEEQRRLRRTSINQKKRLHRGSTIYLYLEPQLRQHRRLDNLPWLPPLTCLIRVTQLMVACKFLQNFDFTSKFTLKHNK